MEVKVRINGAMHKWSFPASMIATAQSMTGETADECKTILKTVIVRLAGILESGTMEGTVSDVEVVCLMHIRNQKDLPDVMKDGISLILDGWKAAEESINEQGRKGLRMMERILPVLMTCENREAFDKFFSSTLYPAMEDGEMKAVVKFLRVMSNWTNSGESPVKKDSHYIEKYLERVYANMVAPVFAVKKRTVVSKRLDAAADTIEEYIDA